MTDAPLPLLAPQAELTVPAAIDDNDQTMDVDETVEAFETAGTYNGAMGTVPLQRYQSDCTVTLDADGVR